MEMNLFKRAIEKFKKEAGESAFVPKADNQAASEATDVAGLKEDFNTLLESLKEAGLMEADED